MRAPLESGGGRTEVRPADFVARACRQPLAPMRPPAPRLLCRACGKCIRVGRTRRPSLERRLGISGRVEEALQVARIRQYEGGLFPENPGRLINGLPWRYVIGHTGDDIGV